MLLHAFLHGFLLSLGLILPIGIQNGFVLSQGSLHKRWLQALPTVVTASLCDTLLVSISIFAVGSISSMLTQFRIVLGIVGIGFLVWMGLSGFRRQSRERERDVARAAARWTTRAQVGFAMSTSLLNPHAWIDTVTVIGGSALAYAGWPERLAFAVACIVVSWLWFFSLSWLGHAAGAVLFQGVAGRFVDKGSAVLMWVSALYLGYLLFVMR